MRLTVCLEGNADGRVLASVDMEEIVKMTITDDIEKSNFNPKMLKACTDTSYECGYQQGYKDGGSDMEQAKQIIIDCLLKQIEQIRADAIDECKNLCRRMGNNTYFTDDWLRKFVQKLEQLKEQK